MKCARQMWKQIFIMLTYANMNMRKNDKVMVQNHA